MMNKQVVQRTKGRKLLLVVLPYLIESSRNANKKARGVRSFLAFPYGVLTIASHIRKASDGLHDAEILDLNIASPLSEEDRLRAALARGDVDVLGFSMSYDISFNWLKKLSAMARAEFPAILQVAGGPAVTTGHKDMIEEGVNLDAMCFSEGEAGLLAMLNADDPASVFDRDPWIRNRPESLVAARPHAVTEDLDNIIDVDYSLVDVPAYSMREAFSPFVKYSSGSKQFFLVTSRGCPFKCNFCAEPSFHGASMRYASVDLIIEHVRKLIDTYGLNVLTIYDDQLLLNRDRAKDLFRKLAQFNIRVEMPNGVTMSYIDEEMAVLMRRAGVDTIFLAIESGSKRVLKEIILKPIAFSRIRPTVELLQANGIFTTAFFVLGLPGETDAERQETRQFILDTGFDWAFFNYATPLRGSALFEQCKREGWLAPEHLRIGSVDMTDYVINAPGIDKEALKAFLFDLNLEANFINNRNLRDGNFELAATTFKEVVNRHEAQPFAHYFLSEAYAGMGIDYQSQSAAHYRRFLEIVGEDAEWSAHAERFGLDFGRTPQMPAMHAAPARV
jgi:anaerobic magnesium-protoporphyrin IX monomethyl ester cyclase